MKTIKQTVTSDSWCAATAQWVQVVSVIDVPAPGELEALRAAEHAEYLATCTEEERAELEAFLSL